MRLDNAVSDGRGVVGSVVAGLDSVDAADQSFLRRITMLTAYVLLQTEVGSVQATLDAITADPGVAWADPVTGPYDVIAACQGNPREVLERLELPGVTRTITCPAGTT
jgi:hypothetical protein